MSKMRVLHLYAGNLYGGIERLLDTLARERNLCPEMDPHFGLSFEGRLSSELRAHGVGVHMLGEVRFSRPWSVWLARRHLAKLMHREHFDAFVCHACGPYAIFAPVARAAGKALILWAHDVPQGTHWLERKATRTRPDLVVAISKFTESQLPRLFPGAPNQLLYYPVRPPLLPTKDEGRQAVRCELGASPDQTVIVIACRLVPWKGHRLLLDALGRLSSHRCVSWIMGGPQRPHEQVYLDELELLVETMGLRSRVRFLGQCSDVASLLGAADIHCQPNTGPEPFGIAFIEALFANLPVVTTSIGAAPEIVTPDCGTLVPPNDPEALAVALDRLISDAPMRGRLAAAGPARAREPARNLPALYNLLRSHAAKELSAS